jgi:hypothetical protein
METPKSSVFVEIDRAPSFDDQHGAYQCCCGTMHAQVEHFFYTSDLQMGASLIAMFSLFGLAINLTYRITMDQFTVSGIIPLMIGAVAVITLIAGLRLRKEAMLVPYLIVQVQLSLKLPTAALFRPWVFWPYSSYCFFVSHRSLQTSFGRTKTLLRPRKTCPGSEPQ